MITAISLLLSLGTPVSQDATDEYLAYLANFDKFRAITGAMISRGGPVSQGSVWTFRIGVGGRSAYFGANREMHCDGKVTYMYSPDENKYLVEKPSAWQSAAAFGKRFSSPACTLPIAIVAKDGEYERRKVRVFTLIRREADPYDLIVSSDKSPPIAIRMGGSQATYVTEFIELHFDRRPSEASWDWNPPKGAVQATSIKD
ncbi:MAG: hypothetical protein ACR2HJ_06105 [Fimbriimonadales bacterium]